MGTQAHVEQDQSELPIPHWSLAYRVAFRFCFIYFGLYCLATQIITSLFAFPTIEIPDPATLSPVRQIIFWTASHVFHAKTPLVYTDSGSGDKIFDWVLAFCLLVFSAAATTIWSVLDGKRQNYLTLHKWFLLFIRFCLAGQMLSYGLSKAVPLQMPYPYLTELLERFGNFSPMSVLWSSIGASPAYEIFAGCAETLGGILLIFPRTALLGALVCLGDLTQVFMLNMTYDVRVKLFSFHLILLVLILLSPEFPRLANFFFLNRSAGSSMQPQLYKTRRANGIAFAAQLIFGLWLLAMNIYGSWTAWYTYGEGRPKSPLYGIWEVDQLSMDGQLRSPLLTDNDRWRRVVFDFPTGTSFERMDDSFANFGASIDLNKKTIALTKSNDQKWKANFTFVREPQDQLTLDGEMDSHKMHLRLHLVDCNKFLLVSRGFHWIQEYPFNR